MVWSAKGIAGRDRLLLGRQQHVPCISTPAAETIRCFQGVGVRGVQTARQSQWHRLPSGLRRVAQAIKRQAEFHMAANNGRDNAVWPYEKTAEPVAQGTRAVDRAERRPARQTCW